MAGRRIPIPFLVAALALVVVPPAATAWIASQRDPAPAAAPAADDALDVTIAVDPLEPLGGGTDAAPTATADASAAADATDCMSRLAALEVARVGEVPAGMRLRLRGWGRE